MAGADAPSPAPANGPSNDKPVAGVEQRAPAGGLAPAAPTLTVVAPPRKEFAVLRTIFKYSYVLLTGLFTVWVVSFTPSPGPPLERFVPSNAASIVHVRDGTALMNAAWDSKPLQELLHDEDFETFFEIPRKRENAEAQYAKLPAAAKWMVSLSMPGLRPFIGGESAIARLQQDGDNRKPQTLLLTRVSGVRGQLLRMGAWLSNYWLTKPFIKARSNIALFDLGGDLVAVGVNGAQPEEKKTPVSLRRPDSSALAPVAQILLRPHPRTRVRDEAAEAAMFESPQGRILGETLPPKVLDALLQPPTAAEVLNVATLPEEIRLDVNLKPDGQLALSGNWSGPVPPLPKNIRPLNEANSEAVNAEGLLPFDAKAGFLAYIERNMRIRKDQTNLSRTQRKWSTRFEKLYALNIDLDRDLWSSFGPAFEFSIRQHESASGYDLVHIAAPLNDAGQGARAAVAELARARWDFIFDGKPSEKPPYVLRVKQEKSDAFILSIKKVVAPAWMISPEEFLVTSDAGEFALIDPGGAAAALAKLPRPTPVAPDRFFLRIDGQRLAPMVEKVATAMMDDAEEDMGTKEFLERFPDAPLRIRLAAKIARLLGNLRVELKPNTDAKSASVSVDWKPGTLVVPEEKEDVVPPPPPPPNLGN